MDKSIKYSFWAVPAAVLLLIVAVSLQPVVLADTVTVTATVAQTVSCASSISSTAFGTLSTGSVSTSTPNASTTLSCNTGNGCTLSVADAGDSSNPGLATTSPAYLIPSPASGFPASSTLVAGTEGYGIHATTTAGGSGGTLSIEARYRWAASGNLAFGGLTLAGKTLASSTAAVNNRQLLIEHGAAISGTTQAGKFEDTITYSCTGN